MNALCMERVAYEDAGLAADSAEIFEVPLLLSGVQMSALEQAAYCRGLTAGEMVRRLLCDFIAGQPMQTA